MRARTGWQKDSEATRIDRRPKYSIRDLAERFGHSIDMMRGYAEKQDFPRPVSKTIRINPTLIPADLYDVDAVSDWMNRNHKMSKPTR